MNLLIFLLVIISVKADLNADNVLLAINCGGEAFKDSKDVQYLEDSYVEGGQSSDFGSQFEIKNTDDQLAYQTERWSETDITYTLPVPEGKYSLVLKFSEVYFNSSNEKVFDIFFGNKKIIANLDIFSKVGKSTALDEFVEFEIKANKLYYQGKIADAAYDNGNVKLIFKKGERDNPKVNAILIVKGGLENTDYQNFRNQLDELEKEKLEKERKQRDIKKRNNLHYDFEEFEEDFVDIDVQSKSSFMKSPIYIILSALILFIFYAYFKPKKEEEKEE